MVLDLSRLHSGTLVLLGHGSDEVFGNLVGNVGDVCSSLRGSDRIRKCDMLEASMPQNDLAVGANLTYERSIVLSLPKVLEVSFPYVDLDATDPSAESLGWCACKTILAL